MKLIDVSQDCVKVLALFVTINLNIAVTFRSSHQRCSIKNVFFEISQNSQENTCARVSF